MSNMRVLVAEDERNIREGLIDTLESEGYLVTAATDGEQAVRLFKQGGFGLVLLDIMMPRVSGYDACRAIRKDDEQVPIIMLTAKSEEIDKVVGLRLGADDYVTKPFGVQELLARIEAVLRRARRAAARGDRVDLPPTLAFGEAQVETKTYQIRRGERVYKMTPRELALIAAFCSRPNEALSRDALLREVWGVEYMGTTRTLDQHIAQLRKKVELDPSNPAVIVTVHGVGYRFIPCRP